MASRTQQKEEARQRRLAEERERAERARRQRRLQMILGAVVIAVVVVVIAVAVSIGGSSSTKPTSAAAKQDAATVSTLLAGIPQAGNRLGSPAAPVTVTEYGDLQCPVCRDFALGAQKQLIAGDVRSGKVQMIYRSLCTATCNGPTAGEFSTQQAAAIAAGLQAHQWDYVELFYHEQGAEGTSYVNDAYLNGLAQQIGGLNYQKWLSDRGSSSLSAQVSADQEQAQSKGFSSTPTIVIQGPKGEAQPIVGDTDYGSLESAIKSVS